MSTEHFTALKRAFVSHEYGIANEALLPIEDIDKLVKFALRAIAIETPVIALRWAKQLNLESVLGELIQVTARES